MDELDELTVSFAFGSGQLMTHQMAFDFLRDAAAGIPGPACEPVAKDAPPQRYLLLVAYQAGPDPRIRRGADGGRDFFTPAELEKACWSFLRGGAQVGLFHGPDETIGHFEVTESYIYRGPDWDVGDGIVVKSGDWLVGGICDEVAWRLYQRGLITGMSPQGTAKRRKVT